MDVAVGSYKQIRNCSKQLMHEIKDNLILRMGVKYEKSP